MRYSLIRSNDFIAMPSAAGWAAGTVLLPAYMLLLAWMWSPFPYGVQWADAVFVVILTVFLMDGGLRRFASPLDFLVLAYVAGAAISLVRLPSLAMGMVEAAKLFYPPLLYLICGTYLTDPVRLRKCIGFLIGGALVVSSIGCIVLLSSALRLPLPGALAALYHLPYFGELPRLNLFFPTPELLGNYLTMVLPVACGYLFAGSARHKMIWGVIGIACLILTEVFTFSHSWGGFLAAGLIFNWNRWQGAWGRWGRRILLAVTIGAILAINLVSIAYVSNLSVEVTRMPVRDKPAFDYVSHDEEWPHLQISASYNYLYYFLLKNVAWKTFLDQPLTGIGLGNFHEATEQAVSRGWIDAYCLRRCDPHSSLLGHLAETGIIGGVTLLCLWIGVLLTGWRGLSSDGEGRDQWVIRAAVAGFAGLLINGINADIMHFRFLWIGLAFMRGRLQDGFGYDGKCVPDRVSERVPQE